ncbi:MAG TPA: hypothetical protein VGI85_14825 [Chthoniobacterales bacterium]|jgi:hypothetical protein
MRLLRSTICLFAFCLFAGRSSISTYDQVAYEHATNGRVDAVGLIATGDFSAHRQEIATVLAKEHGQKEKFMTLKYRVSASTARALGVEQPFVAKEDGGLQKSAEFTRAFANTSRRVE